MKNFCQPCFAFLAKNTKFHHEPAAQCELTVKPYNHQQTTRGRYSKFIEFLPGRGSSRFYNSSEDLRNIKLKKTFLRREGTCAKYVVIKLKVWNTKDVYKVYTLQNLKIFAFFLKRISHLISETFGEVGAHKRPVPLILEFEK